MPRISDNGAMNNRNGLYQFLGGIFTGLVVMSVSAWALWQKPIFWEAMAWQGVILFLLYISCNPACREDRYRIGFTCFLLLLPFTFILAWRVPIDLYFIYTIIWVALVPYYLPQRAWWWSLLAVCIAWFLLRLLLGEGSAPFVKTSLEATFHLFALICAIATRESQAANEKTQQLNRELMATQHLLGEAARGSERTRIARDLHDLLGHHLTALTINLQVAGRLSQGEAKEKIDECHGLSKLLLNDVRDSVSKLREMPMVNLQELLEMALRDTPRVNIRLQVEELLHVDDVNTAEALLRLVQEAVTNTLKHSDAKEVVIEVRHVDDEIVLNYSDNGAGCETLVYGNGLTGMRERIERLGGSLEIESKPVLSIRAVTPLVS